MAYQGNGKILPLASPLTAALNVMMLTCVVAISGVTAGFLLAIAYILIS